jgi:AcrR family transcriptional regulator
MDKTLHLSENAAPDRRTQRTQQALSRALVALIQEKRYDSITIQEICDRANVGRSTFYTHYQDKDDLLATNFQQMMKSLGKPLTYQDGQWVFPVAPLFEHVQGHYHLYQALLWGGGMELHMRAGQKQWSVQIEHYLSDLLKGAQSPAVPIPVIAAYVAGSLQTLLLWWLDQKMPYSPERMDELFQQLVMPGVNAALRAKDSQ